MMAKIVSFNGEPFEIFVEGPRASDEGHRLWRNGIRCRTRGEAVFVHRDDIAKASAA